MAQIILNATKKIVLSVLLIFVFANISFAQNLEKVKIRLQWKHQFEFAGFYVAKEKGYYRDLGLDVELLEYDGATNATDEMLLGKIDYAISYSNIINDYLNGKPIVFVANFFKHSPLAIAAQTNIVLPEDLKGKKVMGVANQLKTATILMMLKRFNISLNDFENIPVNFSIDDFANKKIDAMAIFTTNETYALDKKGVKYNILNPNMYGTEMYDVNLYTSKNEAIMNPQRVKNIKDATVKGWKYAFANQDETVDLILKKYNTQKKTKEALDYEAAKIKNVMLPEVYEIGSIDENRVKIIAENFKDLGLVSKNTPLEFDGFLFENEKQKEVNFNIPEQKYLSSKNILNVCVNSNFYPFEKTTKDKYGGIGAEYFKLFGKTLNLPIKFIPSKSYDEALDNLKKQKCDAINFSVDSLLTHSVVDFSQSFMSSDFVVISRNSEHFLTENNELKSKKIAIATSTPYFAFLKQIYFGFELVETATNKEALELTKNQKVYGCILSAPESGTFLQDEYYGMLKIVAKLDKKIDFKIAVNSHDKELKGIFDKLISNIKTDEHKAIKDKFMTVLIEKNVDYSFVYKLALLIFLVIFLVIAHQMYLRQKIKEAVAEHNKQNELLFQQSKLASLGEMISIIAHQWRQPLNQISFLTMFIRAKAENQEVDEKILEIEKILLFMSDTIAGFQNFYKMDNSEEKFSISEVFEDVFMISGCSISEANISLKFQNNSNGVVIGNKNHLAQTFISVIQNMIDVFKSRCISCPKIDILIFQENDNLKIKIQDNGGGIKVEPIKLIFDPFVTHSIKSSTGLGLYMAKKIIEDKFNGSIYAENVEEGAIFTVTLNIAY